MLRRHGESGNMDDLNLVLHEWEHWAAELLESHLSYPVLCYFRFATRQSIVVGRTDYGSRYCALVLVGNRRRAHLAGPSYVCDGPSRSSSTGADFQGRSKRSAVLHHTTLSRRPGTDSRNSRAEQRPSGGRRRGGRETGRAALMYEPTSVRFRNCC